MHTERFDWDLVRAFLAALEHGSLLGAARALGSSQPTLGRQIGALEVLFERLSPGGILILDDYGWRAYRQQKLAEDPWFEARGYRVVPLPTGQGMLAKR